METADNGTHGLFPRRFTLGKGEKLRHRSLVEGLFHSGSSIYEFPLRMMWRCLDHNELSANFRNMVPSQMGRIQMMITVPKKKRKRAVDRVLMRRRIREAYRLNRLELKNVAENLENGGTVSIAFIYMHNENLTFRTIERKMRSLLKKLEMKLKCQD